MSSLSHKKKGDGLCHLLKSLLSSYVGIIQIRFPGRSSQLPLSLFTSSPCFYFFSISFPLLSVKINFSIGNPGREILRLLRSGENRRGSRRIHPIYFYRYLCYNVPKAIAELVFEEEFFNGSWYCTLQKNFHWQFSCMHGIKNYKGADFLWIISN